MANSVTKVQVSFLDSESKLILNQIQEKLADLDQKLGFITEFLVFRFPGNGNLPGFMENNTGEPVGGSVVTRAGSKRAFHNVETELVQNNQNSATEKRQKVVVYNRTGLPVVSQAEPVRPATSPVAVPNTLPVPSAPNPRELIRTAFERPPEGLNEYVVEDSPLLGVRSPNGTLAIKCENFDENDDDFIEGEDDDSPAPQTETSLQGNEDSIQLDDEAECSTTVDFAMSFPEGALRRAADKAARSFESTQPKVFAWQMLRESVTDDELRKVHISLRTFHGEGADELLRRQLPKVRSVVDATLSYFKWNNADAETKLAKTKLILAHLKNNAKVRNWTLREGRPSTRNPNTPEAIWKRYAALLGPGGLAAAGLLPGHEGNLDLAGDSLGSINDI